MRRITAGLAMAALGLMAGLALADYRSYVWTYEYQTMPKGATEVEWYQTAETGKTSDPQNTTGHETQLELEHGITSRWDGAIYQRFGWDGNGPLNYEGFKVKTRYRLGERSWPVPPVLYVEYKQDGRLSSPQVEAKLITSKDWGKWNAAANYITELGKDGAGWGLNHEVALGASYQVAEKWRAGAEFTAEKEGTFIGPTVSFLAGHNWMALNVGWGAGKAEGGAHLRYIVGLAF